MDAILISNFLLLLTLLASIRNIICYNTVPHGQSTTYGQSDKSEILKQQKQFAVIHAQLLKEEAYSTLTQNKTKNLPPNVDLPKPLKLKNIDYDYDETDNSTIYELFNQDEPRRLKHKASGSYASRLNMALNMAAKQGLDAMIKLYEKTEPDMLRKGEILEPDHPGALLSKFSEAFDGTENNAKAAYATLIATKYFRKTYKLQPDDLGRQAPPPKVSFRRTPLEGLCPPRDQPRCLPAAQRYRTHDGTCNNLKHLRWGSALMPFNRFLPPEYGDGIDTVRGSLDGGLLPSARFVSLLVHGSRESEAPVTLMIAQWGQLIDHDITSTAQPRSVNGSVPRCCGSDDFHPSCLPIKVPLDDPWLAPLKVRCLEFLRSAPAQRRDCVLSWREQTNQATSYLDASPVYSSSARTSDFARVFRNGMLQYGRGAPQEDVCLRGAISSNCIRAGDGRSGEQPGLMALHHVWVSEHNRIALELSDMNPHWSDEKVYQEARRIIGALFQHITYREFLPLVVGREVCKLFDLELLNSGYYNGYDPDVNPTVANSFGAAAFRFGHSLIQGTYMRCDKNHNFLDNNVALHSENNQGDMEGAGSLHRLLRGLSAQKAQMRDEFITAELTNHLFQSGNFPFGLDLAAINIQRGRDHGVPPYTSWREPCGLTPIETWLDLEKVVGPASAKRISHAYRSVHDIDLFVGGIAERPVVGGLVGPTFACIIAQQFSNLRKGDRFWYENSGFENTFTPAQLHSIRRVSLAQIICRTLGGGTLQPHIFIPHDMPGNERIECGTELLASMNLLPWLEEDPFQENRNPPLPPIPPSLAEQALQSSPTSQIFNNVDFIPNGSTGLHAQALFDRRTHNKTNTNTKLSDKLDMRFPPRFTSTLPPRRIVQNKVDHRKRRPVPTPAPNKKPQDFTTRRTVIINNIPLILRRSADPFSTETIDPDAEIRSEDITLQRTNDKTFERDQDAIYVQIKHINVTNPYLIRNKTEKDQPENRLDKEEPTADTNIAQKALKRRPDNGEYEIEINIRQTHNKRPSSQYYYQNDYSSKYGDRNKISTPFSYKPSTPRPTYEQTADRRPTTKPPKIIYIDEQEDLSTTPSPGLLQTFFTLGTNTIIENIQKPVSFFQNNILGGGTNAAPNTAFDSNNPIAPSSSIHSEDLINSGPTSTSSGAHNVFNINIRPSSQSFDLPNSPALHPSSSSGSYGFHSPSRPPSPINFDHGRPNNPFSTAYPFYDPRPSGITAPNRDYDHYQFSSTTRRPYYRPTSTYYPRTKDSTLVNSHAENDSSSANEPPNNAFNYILTTFSSILPAPDNTSKTTDYGDIDSDLASKFDKDGYLRPEHMILKTRNQSTTENGTITDSPNKHNVTVASRDDYVLPVLMETEANILPTTQNLTSYYDAIPRRPATEILAEDYDELLPTKPRRNVHKKPPSIVPFAPLTILTKPERPDRWVIVDEPKEQDPLPEPPGLSSGHTVTIEFPKPIMIRVRNISSRSTG